MTAPEITQVDRYLSLFNEATSDPSILSHFWGYVDDGLSGDVCWPWKGPTRGREYKAGRAYGHFIRNRVGYVASRVAWTFANNTPADPTKIIRHTCDNPICVNPAHLIPGTHKDNKWDAINRNLDGGLAAENRRKTHCKRGHPLIGDNLNLQKGGRKCRACKLAAEGQYRARKAKEKDELVARIAELEADSAHHAEKRKTAEAMALNFRTRALAAEAKLAEARERFQIGDKVEIIPEQAGMEWQGEPPQFIAGVDWHPKHGVTYTTSEVWPPRHSGGFVQGLTDEWLPEHLRRAARFVEENGRG